jgi:hypothetical protein
MSDSITGILERYNDTYSYIDLSAANVDNEFKITVTEEGKEPKEYVFSLADYIATWEAIEETDAENYAKAQKTLPVAKALANYAKAAENYKVTVRTPAN